MKLRLIVVDDNRLFRDGLTAMLNAQHDLTVVAALADGEEALRRVPAAKPHVVLLDQALRKLQRYDWLVLTSVNGVEVFFSRLEKIKSADLSGLRVAAIGPATREAIER